MSDRLRVVYVVVVLALGVFAPVAATAQVPASTSVEVTKELVTLLSAKLEGGMAFIAAKLPDGPARFVGALYLQSVPQLLVVTAQYDPAVLMDGRLAKKDYREAYTDLNSASKAGSRVFFEDLMANGLLPKREEGTPFDMFTGADGRLVKFDGDPKAAKLSDEDYAKAFTVADAQYLKAVQALLAEARKK
jgi:hypothetical protein